MPRRFRIQLLCLENENEERVRVARFGRDRAAFPNTNLKPKNPPSPDEPLHPTVLNSFSFLFIFPLSPHRLSARFQSHSSLHAYSFSKPSMSYGPTPPPSSTPQLEKDKEERINRKKPEARATPTHHYTIPPPQPCPRGARWSKLTGN